MFHVILRLTGHLCYLGVPYRTWVFLSRGDLRLPLMRAYYIWELCCGDRRARYAFDLESNEYTSEADDSSENMDVLCEVPRLIKLIETTVDWGSLHLEYTVSFWKARVRRTATHQRLLPETTIQLGLYESREWNSLPESCVFFDSPILGVLTSRVITARQACVKYIIIYHQVR